MDASLEKLRRQARAAFKARQYGVAIHTYGRLLVSKPADPNSFEDARDHEELGAALHREGRNADAQRELEQVVATWPGYASAHYRLGSLLLRLNQPGKALERFASASELAPFESIYQLSYAELAISQGRHDEASRAVETCLQHDPDNAEALATRLLLQNLQSRFGDAAEEMGEPPAEEQAEVVEGLTSLRKQARAAYKGGQFELAVGYYARLTVLRAPDGASVADVRDHDEFGTSLFRCGRHAEAARELEFAVARWPDSAPTLNKLGTISLRLGRPQQALEAFREAARLAPDKAAYQWSYAELAIALGERSEAEAALDASLALDPDNKEARAAKAAMERSAEIASRAPGGYGATASAAGVAPASDTQFASLVEFIRNRPAEDAPPPPPRIRDDFLPLLNTLLGAIGFLAVYLYVRQVLIG